MKKRGKKVHEDTRYERTNLHRKERRNERQKYNHK